MFKIGINLRKSFFYFLVVIVLLSIGCSKGTNTGINEETKITGSVIEEAQGNCRFANESDCRPIEIRKGEAENEQDAQQTAMAVSAPNKTINLSKEEVLLSNCEEGWKCVEKNYRAFQYANCSWVSIEYCIYGCKNGTCNPAPICKLNSFKCDKDNALKCVEGYEWTLNESCDYKCENGICISKNATIANDTNSTISENLTNSTITNTTNQINSTSDNSSAQTNVCDSCISMINFHYNAGNDCNNLNNEYVTFKNNCLYSCDLTNWNINDASSHSYIFPAFTLGSGSSFTLYTGGGTNTQTELYWNSKYTPCPAIWNNDGDTLYLNTQNGIQVLICPYPNNGSITNCPDL